MKKNLLAFFLSFSYSLLAAQPTWSWLQGDRYSPGYGIYGLKGVADPRNRPGNRTDETSCKDNAGSIWVFGGHGQSAGGTGMLNDLWKYEPSSGIWTWMSGQPVEDLTANYGQKGVAASTNRIGARSNSVSWLDSSGILWVFGGKSVDPSTPNYVSAYLNDLWKYDPSTGLWTWMSGDSFYNRVLGYAGKYGQKGVAAASNYPGSRFSATNWTDLNGDVWLYGGEGMAYTTTIGMLNDLWKFSIATQQWIWIAGDTIVNQPGNFGTRGVAAPSNKPGAKSNAENWVDGSGRFFLFGGQSTATVVYPAVFTNDLWMFSPSTGFWTMIVANTGSVGNYGTRGLPSTLNFPGARAGSRGTVDASGNLLLYGGSINSTSTFNDLWKYNPTTGEWTWLNGSMGSGSRPAVYGVVGMASDSTMPAGGVPSIILIDNYNNLLLGSPNSIFRYTPSIDKWTCVSGDTIRNPSSYVSYGAKGVSASTNKPGLRAFSSSWADMQGNFWLFGGGYGSSFQDETTAYSRGKNDIWKYSPLSNQWTWMGGDSSLNSRQSYGTKGIAALSNQPPARQRATSWRDSNGDFWIFGGIKGYQDVCYNDLWKYNTGSGMWTWVSGDSLTGSSGNYGTIGVAAQANKPGCRFGAKSWTDKDGNLWLYGGMLNVVLYNDLWKFTISTGLWTWVSGDKFNMYFAPYYQPTYGQQGVPGSGGQPGGRTNAVSWTDTAGYLWMFGGMAYLNIKSQTYNDLWKYSPLTGWVWMSGDNTPNLAGRYGNRSVASASNNPAARNAAATWTDGKGNLYLFGGNVDTIPYSWPYPITNRYYNDVWKYSIVNNMWTWLSGDSVPNYPGYYGAMGTASVSNTPGARTGSMSWSDGSGKLWMYGGYGYAESGLRYLNDMLAFAPQSTLPVLFNNFTAQQQNKSALLLWSTAQEFNSRLFTVERSPNGTDYSNIGSLPAAGNATMVSNYYFTDKSPLNGNNFYRVKETDADGSATYSVVKQLTFGEQIARFSIINNPVIHDIQLNVELPFTQDISVQLTDANGRLLSIRKYVGSKGSTIISVPATSLSHGTYMITVTGESLKETKVLLK